MKSTTKTTVNFEIPLEYLQTEDELILSVTAEVRFGEAPKLYGPAEECHDGRPDEATITALSFEGAPLAPGKISDRLHRIIEAAAIERAYAEQEVFEAAY